MPVSSVPLAIRTSKPSDRRSASSEDPGAGGPVRMAVDRRTHSLELTRGLRAVAARGAAVRPGAGRRHVG
ncbi:hypothetical protein BN2537_3611 [Streptomyces venezuelae]|nr:hypothetical protein BN2537_3611 [Streptomyces venezuelae]